MGIYDHLRNNGQAESMPNRAIPYFRDIYDYYARDVLGESTVFDFTYNEESSLAATQQSISWNDSRPRPDDYEVLYPWFYSHNSINGAVPLGNYWAHYTYIPTWFEELQYDIVPTLQGKITALESWKEKLKIKRADNYAIPLDANGEAVFDFTVAYGTIPHLYPYVIYNNSAHLVAYTIKQISETSARIRVKRTTPYTVILAGVDNQVVNLTDSTLHITAFEF